MKDQTVKCFLCNDDHGAEPCPQVKERNPTSGGREVVVKRINAHGPNCIGTKAHNRHVMISYTPDEKDISFFDVFLTKTQAVALVKELQASIDENAEGAEVAWETIYKPNNDGPFTGSEEQL